MKNRIILTCCFLSSLGMAGTYILGKAIAERKINKKINSLGNLNVTYNGDSAEMYVTLNNVESLLKLKKTKYAVFNVKILEAKQQKIDA